MRPITMTRNPDERKILLLAYLKPTTQRVKLHLFCKDVSPHFDWFTQAYKENSDIQT